ncbi:MAG TPA: DUF4870 domain-containing protein [Anaerolineales bacterium]|nr:DUF4870 domain-containing protein [Anaerolineales bacterium]
MNNAPTTEDRIWAVISHLSSLALGMGIVLPIIGWVDQRRKSNYASFQCLQALGYQSLGYTVWVLFSAVAVIIFVIIMLPTLNAARGPNEVGIWMSIYIVFIFGLFGSYFLLPIIAAISCALGEDFRYPILGNRLVSYLGYQQTSSSEESNWLIEDHENRWVAAIGHFAVIIALWGMLAPMTAWILFGKRSDFLKFQSIQTLVYQASVTILYFGSVFLFLLGFTIISLLALMGWTGDVRVDSSMGIVGIIFLGGSLLVLFIVILFVPLLHILGQWAGYRVLKGDNYRYPFVGRLVESWIVNKTPLAEDGD